MVIVTYSSCNMTAFKPTSKRKHDEVPQLTEERVVQREHHGVDSEDQGVCDARGDRLPPGPRQPHPRLQFVSLQLLAGGRLAVGRVLAHRRLGENGGSGRNGGEGRVR